MIFIHFTLSVVIYLPRCSAELGDGLGEEGFILLHLDDATADEDAIGPALLYCAHILRRLDAHRRIDGLADALTPQIAHAVPKAFIAWADLSRRPCLEQDDAIGAPCRFYRFISSWNCT